MEGPAPGRNSILASFTRPPALGSPAAVLHPAPAGGSAVPFADTVSTAAAERINPTASGYPTQQLASQHAAAAHRLSETGSGQPIAAAGERGAAKSAGSQGVQPGDLAPVPAAGRDAALASIVQRRAYGAAPRAPAGGPLSKSAERAMREGVSPTSDPELFRNCECSRGLCRTALSVMVTKEQAASKHGVTAPCFLVLCTHVRGGASALSDEDDEHEDGHGMVYAAAGEGPLPWQPIGGQPIARVATPAPAGAASTSCAMTEQQPVLSYPAATTSAQHGNGLQLDAKACGQEPDSVPLVIRTPAGGADSDDCPPDHAESPASGLEAVATLQRTESPQELADQELAKQLHAQEVAAAAERRKRAREAFLCGALPCGTQSGKRGKRGPLDAFVRK